MSVLFGTSTDNIGLHLKNIFSEGELEEDRTAEDFSVVRQKGKREVRRRIKHYNLDTIIAVGCRVRSKRATGTYAGTPVCLHDQKTLMIRLIEHFVLLKSETGA